MSEIKDRYDRHPSIKSITSITVITRRVVSIDFYRLIDAIDNVYVIDIDSYRFIERFSDIDFYRLPTSAFLQRCWCREVGIFFLVLEWRIMAEKSVKIYCL